MTPACRRRACAMGEFLREAQAGEHVGLGTRWSACRAPDLHLGPGLLARTGSRRAGASAAIGAGTGEILRQAGFGAKEIDRLARDGAIRL